MGVHHVKINRPAFNVQMDILMVVNVLRVVMKNIMVIQFLNHANLVTRRVLHVQDQV